MRSCSTAREESISVRALTAGPLFADRLSCTSGSDSVCSRDLPVAVAIPRNFSSVFAPMPRFGSFRTRSSATSSAGFRMSRMYAIMSLISLRS